MGDYTLKMEAATGAVLRLNDKIKILVDDSSEGSKEWQGKLLGGGPRSESSIWKTYRYIYYYTIYISVYPCLYLYFYIFVAISLYLVHMKFK